MLAYSWKSLVTSWIELINSILDWGTGRDSPLQRWLGQDTATGLPLPAPTWPLLQNIGGLPGPRGKGMAGFRTQDGGQVWQISFVDNFEFYTISVVDVVRVWDVPIATRGVQSSCSGSIVSIRFVKMICRSHSVASVCSLNMNWQACQLKTVDNLRKAHHASIFFSVAAAIPLPLWV
mgnify:CR=1 FL=1